MHSTECLITLNKHYHYYYYKALVGAFSVIVKTNFETDGALHSTSDHRPVGPH